MAIDEMNEVMKKARKIIAFFNNKGIARQQLRKIQTERSQVKALLMPVDTRWGSNAACLSSLLRSQNVPQAAVVCENISKVIDANIRREIF